VVNILGGALAAAAIVLCGGLYAFLVAYGRRSASAYALRAADAAFALLVLSALALAVTLRLDGLWLAMVAALLVGYRFAPIAVWRLCVRTHAAARTPPGDAQ
jgi:hypothetical protein